MKQRKFLFFLIAIALLSCLVVAASSYQLSLQASESDMIPTPFAPTAIIIPKPSVLIVTSPTNTTYSTNTVELTYTVNSKVVWSYYGLNIGGNGAGSSDYTGINELYTLHGLVPFKGNITLNLPEGKHRLLLAVQTEESRGSSVPITYQTIDFIIDTTSNPTPTPTPSPPNFGPTSSPTPVTSIPEFSSLAIPLLLTIMLAAGLLVYHKKHKAT